MKKIIDFIAGLPHDKILHAFAGALIALWATAIIFLVVRLCGLPVRLCCTVLMGAIISIAALVAKEIHDALHPETDTPEAADVIYGIYGILLVDVPLLLTCAVV